MDSIDGMTEADLRAEVTRLRETLEHVSGERRRAEVKVARVELLAADYDRVIPDSSVAQSLRAALDERPDVRAELRAQVSAACRRAGDAEVTE